MGRVTSPTNLSGTTINGILLGDPAVAEDGSYVWDDERIPDAEVVASPAIVAAVEFAQEG